MEDNKQVCSGCDYEAKVGGPCPNCNTPLVATCPVCGNPVVGGHVHVPEQTQRFCIGGQSMPDKEVVIYTTPT